MRDRFGDPHGQGWLLLVGGPVADALWVVSSSWLCGVLGGVLVWQHYHHLLWGRDNTACIVIACSPSLHHVPRRRFDSSAAAFSSTAWVLCLCLFNVGWFPNHRLSVVWLVVPFDDPNMVAYNPLATTFMEVVAPNDDIHVTEKPWSEIITWMDDILINVMGQRVKTIASVKR